MSSEGLESTKVRHRVDTSYFGGPSSGFNSSLGRLDCHLLHPRPASFRHKPSASRIFGADIYIYILYINIYKPYHTTKQKAQELDARSVLGLFRTSNAFTFLSHIFCDRFATWTLRMDRCFSSPVEQRPIVPFSFNRGERCGQRRNISWFSNLNFGEIIDCREVIDYRFFFLLYVCAQDSQDVRVCHQQMMLDPWPDLTWLGPGARSGRQSSRGHVFSIHDPRSARSLRTEQLKKGQCAAYTKSTPVVRSNGIHKHTPRHGQSSMDSI